jgi:hypothetical protein
LKIVSGGRGGLEKNKILLEKADSTKRVYENFKKESFL